MAYAQHETRRLVGLREDGSRIEDVTVHCGPRRPESVAEWREQAAARLGGAAASPAGRLVVRLLGDDLAAVGDGAALTVDERYAVLQTLTVARQRALDGYPRAGELMTRVRRAWVARWGDDPPRMVS